MTRTKNRRRSKVDPSMQGFVVGVVLAVVLLALYVAAFIRIYF